MGYSMKDNNGLLFFDDSSKGKEIDFNIPYNKDRKSIFYEFNEDPNYIIKKSLCHFDKEKLLYMLSIFNEIKDNVHKTKLPTMYYKENNIISGSIVYHHKESKTLYEISRTKKLEKLMEVYKRDDDKLHNLFILYNEILDILEELYDNGVCYFDSNSTNFVFKDNDVNLIDFDPQYIYFRKSRGPLLQTLCSFDGLVDKMNNRFIAHDEFIYLPSGFNGFRKHLVKVENRVRKREYV